MATTQSPSAAVRQSNFEQSVAYALHLWPALTLSVQNSWGGPDTADKRDWFVGAVVDLFSDLKDTTTTQEEPDQEYVETFLLQVMVDEFEVNVDDESGSQVAEQIIKARGQCVEGKFDEYNILKERFSNRNSKKVDALYKRIEDADQDTDWESDGSGDDDEDENMDEAPALVRGPKEKPPPEIDEDGFTKVTRKR